MTPPILALSDVRAQNPMVAGTKGANLARMTAAGLAVPQGFVVTSEVFSEAILCPRSEIHKAILKINSSDSLDLIEATAIVRDLILKSSVPEEVVSEIQSAYSLLEGGAVSVRSSATTEDLEDASFAGQYDTFLNVFSLTDVLDRLRHVWASLYSRHAITYARLNGIDDIKGRMAVVIQRQITPEVSGVIFTKNPVTGEDQILVDAALGLGEGVVTGSVPSDHFVMEPITGKLLNSVIVRKEFKIVPDPKGGVRRDRVPTEMHDAPTLTCKQLSLLVDLAQKTSVLFDSPQDLEFGIAQGQLMCLQARPITGEHGHSVEYGFDSADPIDSNYGWLLNPMGMVRGPLYRLQQDFVESYIHGQRICFEETGSERSRNCIGHVVGGYSYVRSPNEPVETVTCRQENHRKLCDQYIEQGTSYYAREIAPKAEGILAELQRMRPSGKRIKVQQNFDYLKSAIEAAGFVMGHLHWCMAHPSNRLDWPSVYNNITGEPPSNSNIFVQAIPNMTTRLIKRIRRLAKVVKETPELSTIFASENFSQLDRVLQLESSMTQSFRLGFDSLLKVYGFRTGWGFGSDTDFMTTTWNMDPTKPLKLIGEYAKQDLEELDQLEEDALLERRRNTKRIRNSLIKSPDRLQQFDFYRARARSEVLMMENHNHLMEQCTVGQVRSAIFEMGEALVSLKGLEKPDDVVHLSLNEIKHAVTSNNFGTFKDLVRSRRDEWRKRSLVKPPKTLGRGEIAPDPSGGKDVPAGELGLQGNLIYGVAASKGRVTGPAKLVSLKEPVPSIRRGDILVAQNVGPNWTPIFPLLGGLVLDEGSISQHAALVAREYRIPTVILTKDSTRSIRDNQKVTVDGTEGIVYLL